MIEGDKRSERFDLILQAAQAVADKAVLRIDIGWGGKRVNLVSFLYNQFRFFGA